ncbi:MAG: hypothetical protein CMB51_01515 [Euryarchaeota archaeon]|nr:hypothetical protein [Euryarchaeota archaeon]
MRAIFAIPVALALVAMGAWMLIDDTIVDSWIQNQQASVGDDYAPLGIQSEEKWLVVVVDFSDAEVASNQEPEFAKSFVENVAQPFLEQATNGEVSLNVTAYPEVIRAEFPLSTYGADQNGVRDSGLNGINPTSLAEELVYKINLNQSFSWNSFDLDSDGNVDRFLILHPAKPQEDGQGGTSSIWSHYSEFESKIDISGEKTISDYVISSMQSSNYRGTMVHEMLHQLGAIDLYPVHDEVSSIPWKGIGAWDLMASGNWNGQGAWPALPTSPTLELIGHPRHQDVDLAWPGEEGCTGPNIELDPMGEGGQAIRILIDEEQYIWIEWRNDSGFDFHLPGNGILVLVQDLRNGDLSDNEVNSNPEQPWLIVLEADGHQDLVNGVGKGEPEDLFQDGDVFGSDGIILRNRDGVKVDWNATIREQNNHFYIDFESEKCGHNIDVDLADDQSIILPQEGIHIQIEGVCTDMTIDLSSTDGREVTYSDGMLSFSSDAIPLTSAHIQGSINCNEGTPIDIYHPYFITQNRPISTLFNTDIPINEPHIVEVPISFEGSGKQTWYVGIDGPISRIATTDAQQQLGNGDSVLIEINPNGLLTPGMIAKGNLVLATDTGEKWQIPLTFQANTAENSLLNDWRQPNKIIPIMAFLLAIWFLLGINSPTGQPPSKTEELPDSIQESSIDPSLVNPFRQPDQ